jgi:beta-aspartyl-peptidase (threonine type)
MNIAERPIRLSRPAVVVHGGAGAWKNADKEAVSRAIREALENGMEASRSGGSVEMVVEAVASMEDSGIFDAGVGSVLDLRGHVTMDAAVMRGYDLRAGAVAAVTYPKNPIRLAKAVMERTPHVMIVGSWADELAKRVGLEPFPGPSRRSLERWKQLKESGGGDDELARRWIAMAKEVGLDTVGAVAVDSGGRLAAAVSTGGVIMKFPGRVGDSPIVGAGLYADGLSAFAATGIGEYIMSLGLSLRASLAYAQRRDIAEAVESQIKLITETFGPGTAGLIGIDFMGNAWGSANTNAMPWGVADGTRLLVLGLPEGHS